MSSHEAEDAPQPISAQEHSPVTVPTDTVSMDTSPLEMVPVEAIPEVITLDEKVDDDDEEETPTTQEVKEEVQREAEGHTE